MNELTSILTSVKKLLGMTESYTTYDPDIIIHINTVFSMLRQQGIGPSTGFAITGSNETWDDYIQGHDIEEVKSYLPLKVRHFFDPPSGAAKEVSEAIIEELEWRMRLTEDRWWEVDK